MVKKFLLAALLLCCSCDCYAAILDNILCCIEMDENTGTTAFNNTGDTTFNASITNATWGTGKLGSCLTFNGTDAYASISPTLLSNRTNGTVTWWMKPGRNWNSFVAERMWGQSQASGVGPDFSMMHFSDNTLYMGWWNTSNDDRTTLATGTAYYQSGTWFHYAFTWENGGNSVLYINGAAVGTAATSNPPTTVGSMAQNLRLGHSLMSATGFWSGSLDQWTCWSRALTSTEIQYVYNSGNGRAYPFSSGRQPAAYPLRAGRQK